MINSDNMRYQTKTEYKNKTEKEIVTAMTENCI